MNKITKSKLDEMKFDKIKSDLDIHSIPRAEIDAANLQIKNYIDSLTLEKIAGWQIILWVVTHPILEIKLLYYLIRIIDIINKIKESNVNNDTKTTILGILGALITLILTVVFKDSAAAAAGVSSTIVIAIGAVWAAIQALLGIFTNKPK